jgi:hypothetical protein
LKPRYQLESCIRPRGNKPAICCNPCIVPGELLLPSWEYVCVRFGYSFITVVGSGVTNSISNQSFSCDPRLFTPLISAIANGRNTCSMSLLLLRDDRKERRLHRFPICLPAALRFLLSYPSTERQGEKVSPPAPSNPWSPSVKIAQTKFHESQVETTGSRTTTNRRELLAHAHRIPILQTRL